MSRTYTQLKWLVRVSFTLGVLCLIGLAAVASVKSLQTQSAFMGLFVLALVSVITVLTGVWYMDRASGETYHDNRKYFQSKGDCILDPSWKKLPGLLFASTDLGSYHSWSLFIIAALTIAAILGLLVFAYIMSKMPKKGKSVPRQTTIHREPVFQRGSQIQVIPEVAPLRPLSTIPRPVLHPAAIRRTHTYIDSPNHPLSPVSPLLRPMVGPPVLHRSVTGP